MNVLPALAIAVSLFAGTDLPLLRSALSKANDAVSRDAERVALAGSALDAASAELARREESVRNDEWFAARAHRNQLAEVSETRNRFLAAKESLRSSEKARDEARTALRVGLLEEASRLLDEGDAEGRAGRRESAEQRYSSGMKLLKEASANAPETAGIWDGYGRALPLTGSETRAELQRQVDAYRAERIDIERKLERLTPELQAAEEASAAWERLSRFRGILERAGGTAASDPRPLRDALVELHRRGTELQALAEQNTRRVEALLAGVLQ